MLVKIKLKAPESLMCTEPSPWAASDSPELWSWTPRQCPHFLHHEEHQTRAVPKVLLPAHCYCS